MINNDELIAIIEGIIFINGDEGIDIKDIEKVLKISKKEIKNLILILSEKYKKNNHGLNIQNFAETKYRLTTLQKHYKYYLELKDDLYKYKKLSKTSLEVLSIIAYKGPITRMEIEKIRGVNSDYLINKLIELELIKENGQSSAPGKPFLFKITDNFMKVFNLKSLDELPKINLDSDNQINNLFN